MSIDAAEQIEKFQEFIEQSYQQQLHEHMNKGLQFILIDFFDLTKYDPKLADQLLEEPEETTKAAEMALEQFEVKKGFRVRFRNLPKSQEIFIRNLRSKHLLKFIAMEGIIRQSSEVRPQAVSAKFECPSCGNTITMPQIDQQFREPTRCSCGRKGKFRLLSKDLVDVQRLVIEESPENLEGGAQPKRMQIFLREDLVEPRMEKRTTPGTRIVVNGSLYEVPIQTKTGATSTRFDLAMQANYIEPVEEDYSEINITPEDEKEIKKLAKDKDIHNRIIRSIAPSIYGHERIKEAILLQLFGGIRKIKKDGTIVRGDLHVLLVGDPGCIVGESQVSLYDRGMEKIENLGTKHLEKITLPVATIDGHDLATKFHRYEKKLVLKVTTETGKHLTCTLDHQLLSKEGWKRADCLQLGEAIRVMPEINHTVQDYVITNFTYAPKSSESLKEVELPELLTEDLAALYGYILGDGNMHPKRNTVTCYVSDEEIELLQPVRSLLEKVFAVSVSYSVRQPKESMIINVHGRSREVQSSEPIHLLEINSKHIAQALSFLSVKRVPQSIFQSPKSVIISFLRWLFEADGCAFGNGRGRTSIQLKSSRPDFLTDVQLLLLYLGIQSRIYEDNLSIRRAHDMQLYIDTIGFFSEKKKKTLGDVQKIINQRSRRRKGNQEWERIRSIDFVGIRDVYDFEVPKSHMFIANGIVSHNCGKSQMLTFVNNTAPKSRYVAGRSASGAGLTCSVVKDEFLRGWALEAGAMVLADKGILVLDEMDKISKEDTSALHEAMEQQHISVAKANIQATLRTQTSILGAANPKLGRFDPFTPIPNQIDMPPALINRFDLIFVMRDIPNKELDGNIAARVLQSHAYKDSKPELEAPFIRKYLAYAKQKIFPVLTDQAVETIKKFYVELRSTGSTGDGAIKPIPISARQLEAVVRLAEASARIKLKKEVEEDDALRAIGLLKYCMTEVGMDPETGKIDIDRMTTGISASTRGRIIDVKEVLYALSEEKQGGPISIEEDLKPKVFEKGITEKKLEEAIDMLKRAGDFYEPKKGWLQKI